MAPGRKAAGDGLFVVIAPLPWWASLQMGLDGWWICWSYAEAPRPTPTGTGLRRMVMRAWWHGLANTGQYAIPLLCCAAAVVSWIRRRRPWLRCASTDPTRLAASTRGV